MPICNISRWRKAINASSLQRSLEDSGGNGLWVIVFLLSLTLYLACDAGGLVCGQKESEIARVSSFRAVGVGGRKREKTSSLPLSSPSPPSLPHLLQSLLYSHVQYGVGMSAFARLPASQATFYKFPVN